VGTEIDFLLAELGIDLVDGLLDDGLIHGYVHNLHSAASSGEPANCATRRANANAMRC
jgi:hypothetical protein